MDTDSTITTQEIVHVIVGGAICLSTMFTLFGLIGFLLEQILMRFNMLGVVVFESFTIARTIISFASVYLISGFLGGLYTGYFTQRGLKATLPITGIIGFVGFSLLLFFSGGSLDFSENFLERLILPISGSIIGAYLGGYTINWPSEEEETEEEGKIRLELEE